MDSGLVGRLLEYCLGRSPKVFGHLHTNPAVGWMVAEMLANAGYCSRKPSTRKLSWKQCGQGNRIRNLLHGERKRPEI